MADQQRRYSRRYEDENSAAWRALDKVEMRKAHDYLQGKADEFPEAAYNVANQSYKDMIDARYNLQEQCETLRQRLFDAETQRQNAEQQTLALFKEIRTDVRREKPEENPAMGGFIKLETIDDKSGICGWNGKAPEGKYYFGVRCTELVRPGVLLCALHSPALSPCKSEPKEAAHCAARQSLGEASSETAPLKIFPHKNVVERKIAKLAKGSTTPLELGVASSTSHEFDSTPTEKKDAPASVANYRTAVLQNLPTTVPTKKPCKAAEDAKPKAEEKQKSCEAATSKKEPSEAATSKKEPSEAVTSKKEPSEAATSKKEPSEAAAKKDEKPKAEASKSQMDEKQKSGDAHAKPDEKSPNTE
ncbi:MAG: hypothetical protein M0R33_15235 [Methylomonas sp.]|jgi:hypothetical protein|uniref:hypothetical protein n=1 Tax=Methylomonas sp. TaxID=418 RepID=UPI0025F71376|nr:hypothetical protein [Methylomonas sp.]MCK9607795.1 hypothetical protein [Methylomonas sp.]